MDARLLSTIKKMQNQIQKKLEELYQQEFTYDYQNSAVMVTVKGDGKIISIEVNKTLIDPDDAITMQEMIVEAINSAQEQVKAKADEIQNSLMPGGFGGMF